MEYRILGPVAVWVDGAELYIGGPRECRALAALLLGADHPVGIPRLVEVLWGENPPRTAAAQVRNTIAALRRHLVRGTGLRPPVTRSGGGFVLKLGEDTLDARDFDRRVGLARVLIDDGKFADAADALRAALEMWRGPALGGMGGPVLDAEAHRLDEQRLACLQRRIEVDIALGRYDQLVGELAALVREHPLREHLAALQMSTLYHAGRRQDALDVFSETRVRLADHAGLDPGPELIRLQQAILRGDAVPPPTLTASPPAPDDDARGGPVPAQLPPAVADFTGRGDQLAELDRLCTGPDPAAVLVTICGPPGVGKTALAVRWAHAARDRYPDGQLFLDLHGYAQAPPMRPVDALGPLLRGVGVPPEAIPPDPAEATALFRTTVSDRRVLLVLDNARDAGQVRSLLPGGTGCLVVVTSRDRLSGLVARDGARRLTLDVLAPAESLALLRRTVPGDRVAAEPAAAADLAAACGHLPLALRIVAANLSDRPQRSIAGYVAELRTAPGLTALEVDGDDDASTRAAFRLSYQALEEPVRRVFRLLALAPGPDIGLPAATALAAVPHCERLLGTLTAAHLLRRVEMRYTWHDLIRRYADELLRSDEPEADRAAATQRLLGFYLSTVDNAVTLLSPQFVRLPLPAFDATGLTFTTNGDALTWLEHERANLVAAVRHASQHGPAPAAWLLADRLRGYFWISRHMADWLATAEAGLAAATAHADQRAQAAAHLSLGIAHRTLSRHDRSTEHLHGALALSREVGWAECEASALGSLGIAFAEVGNNRAAIEQFTAALELNRRLGRHAGEAVVLANLGNLRLELGDLRSAARDLTNALALHRAARSPGGEAITVATRGVVRLYLGRLDGAEDDLNRSRALHDEIADRYGQPFALAGLATLYCVTGRPAEAAEAGRTALDIARDTGNRRGELYALIALGDVALRLGAVPDAMSHFRQALRLADEHRSRHMQCEARAWLADAYLHAGTPDQALAEATDVRRLAHDAGYAMLEGQALTTLARVHLARGADGEAASCAARAVAIHRRTGYRQAESAARVVLEQATTRHPVPS